MTTGLVRGGDGKVAHIGVFDYEQMGWHPICGGGFTSATTKWSFYVPGSSSGRRSRSMCSRCNRVYLDMYEVVRTARRI